MSGIVELGELALFVGPHSGKPLRTRTLEVFVSLRTELLAYVRDFEMAFLTGDFSRIEPHFHEDAIRSVTPAGSLGADDRGRGAVVRGLERDVNALDRRFDARIPEIIEGPVVREDGLFLRWRLTFVRAGLPELEIEGEHVTAHGGGKIRRIDEHVDADVQERVGSFLAEHDGALRPAGNAPALPGPHEATRIRHALLRSAVRGYAAAKSQGDVEGALASCAVDFSIDTVPFGIKTGDRDSTAPTLALFFAAFPDYSAHTEGMAVQGDEVAWWGEISVTSAGPFLGLDPTGRSTRVPAFSVFTFRDMQLVSERFHFDLASLCEGLGIPVQAVSERLAALRRGVASPVPESGPTEIPGLRT